MMNRYFKISNLLAIFSLVFCLIGCTEEERSTAEEAQKGSVNFAITLAGEVIEQSGARSAATAPKPIKRLWHAIIDADGKAVFIRTQHLKPDFSNLIVEGLSNGSYSIVFLATTGDVPTDAIDELDEIAQQWLINPSDQAPLDEDYLYERIDFDIDHNAPAQTLPVELQRVTGRVELDLKADNPQSLRFITHIDITYDQGSYVYQQMAGDQTFTGQMVIKNFDVTQNLGFYSLPAAGKLAGVVTITAITTDGQQVISKHRFADAEIRSGVISTIRILYTHPEDNMGSFTVALKDYTATNSLQMLRDDEPRSTFYNNSLRSFYVDKPLQVWINAQKELQVRFYSAIAIKDTKVLVRFKKYSTEFFELAHYEEILPYHESRLPIPIVSKARVFRSKDGRNLMIPAHPNLSDADCELKIVTDDPYMKKIATITCHWRITYNPFSATEPPTTSWRHMTPALCREGVVLATNMAFMFAHQDFHQEMEKRKSDGTYFYDLKDNNSKPIPHEEIMRRIRVHSGLNMGTVGGVNGLGGGATYGLTAVRYYDHYWDAGTAASFHKTTAYHELGHCIGWGHSSTMTYGNQWTVLCSRVMYDMGEASKLPVNSKWVLNTSGSTDIPELPEDNDDDHEGIM